MLSNIVAILTIIGFVATVVGVYWRINIRLKLLENECRMRFDEMRERIQMMEALNNSVNRKFGIIGRNLSAILHQLKMEPQKNILNGD